MKQEEKDKIKAAYWFFAVLPIIFINILPYVGFDFPEKIETDATYYNLLMWFSMIFVLFMAGSFASFKCIFYSEIPPTKIMATIFCMLYLLIVVSMIYFYFDGFISPPQN